MLKTKIRPVDQELEVKQEWLWPEIDDGTWDGPVNDWKKEHSKKLFKYITKFDVCIQAGGAAGLYPCLLSERFKTIYTFEPHPLFFYCLVNNCQDRNIIKFNAALGDTHIMIKNTIEASHNIGCNKAIPEPNGIIPQLMIDDLALQQCDFIMLDIEENEINALRGARETIKRFRPVLCLENAKRDSIKDFMKEFAYKDVEQCGADNIFTPT